MSIVENVIAKDGKLSTSEGLPKTHHYHRPQMKEHNKQTVDKKQEQNYEVNKQQPIGGATK